MIQFKTEQRQLQKTSKTPPNKGRGLQSTSISLKLDLPWQVGMRGRESWVTAESLGTLRNLLVSWFFETRSHHVDQADLSLQRASVLASTSSLHWFSVFCLSSSSFQFLLLFPSRHQSRHWLSMLRSLLSQV